MEIKDRKRVFLVDDHPLMRKGLRMLIETEQDLHVCGEACSAEEAIEKMLDSKPSLVIIDISLPGMSGIDLIKHFQHVANRPQFMVFSRHDESLYAERAIRAGAKGYVMKSEEPMSVLKAIRRIDAGAIYVSSAINERLLQSLASNHQAVHDSPLEILSDRELEVFEMTGKGLGTRIIAETLDLSIKTIESYRARIKSKLNLVNASELMQHAVQWVENERLLH